MCVGKEGAWKGWEVWEVCVGGFAMSGRSNIGTPMFFFPWTNGESRLVATARWVRWSEREGGVGDLNDVGDVRGVSGVGGVAGRYGL